MAKTMTDRRLTKELIRNTIKQQEVWDIGSTTD
jgi:hypothetical protein